MTIKIKLSIVLIIICAVCLGLVSLMIGITYQSTQKIKASQLNFEMMVTTATARSSIDRYIKEVAEIIKFDRKRDKKKYEQYELETRRLLKDWTRTRKLMIDIENNEEVDFLNSALDVQKKYRHIAEQLNVALRNSSANSKEQALQIMDTLKIDINDLFENIDNALQSEIQTLKLSHQQLIGRFSTISWWLPSIEGEIAKADTQIDEFTKILAIRSGIERQMKYLVDYVVTGNFGYLEYFNENGILVKVSIAKWFKTIKKESTVILQKSTELNKAQEIENLYYLVIRSVDIAFEMKKKNQIAQALKYLEKEVEPILHQRLLPAIDQVINNKNMNMAAAHRMLTDYAIYSGLQFTLMTISILFIPIILVISLMRSIMISFRRLKSGIQSIAKGDLTYRIDMRSNDELGQLASSFNQMTEDLQKITQLEKETMGIAMSRERLARIGEISSGTAHTIGNPLHGVMNCVEILSGRIPPDDQKSKEILELMNEGLIRIDKITLRLLSFARENPLHIAETKIQTLLNDVIEFLKIEADKKGISICVEIEDDLPIMQADSNYLSEAIINVISNAIDACHKGDRIIVAAKLIQYQKACVMISVYDSGEGISDKALPKIMDPFFTTKPIGKGTGLGLPIARRIIEDHGGKLKIKSNESEGTTIELLLPIIPPKNL